MAMVATVAIVFIFIFSVTLLFHFVQQNRYTTAMQMESVARSIRAPLSNAILKADIPQAEIILNQIQPAGIIGRADVVLPNQFQALRVSFIPEKPVPQLIARLFELPVQITLPLYSLERPANPQPLAYLVLQADSERMYRYIVSTLSTLTTTWLLLSLMITVALTWCINRLIVHPLRKITRALNAVPADDLSDYQLPILNLHHDDEIGSLVRAYNLNQRIQRKRHEMLIDTATHYPVSSLPNKSLLLALLKQHLDDSEDGALMVIDCDTLKDAAGVLNDEQRDVLLLTLTRKIRDTLPSDMVLAQINAHIFAVIARGLTPGWRVMALAESLREEITSRLPVQGLQLLPVVSIGIATQFQGADAEVLFRRGVAACFAAKRLGQNQIQFFDPVQMELAHRRLTEVHELRSGLENGRFALWLQPQIELATGRIAGAEVLLRQQQENGEWELPDGLITQIEECGLMVHFGDWILEETCRVLANWQRRGIMLNISVNISALQIKHCKLTAVMQGLLSRYRIAPGTLTLEITESNQITDIQAAIDALRPLREAGVTVALDDFGMGYASLAQLQKMKALPVDVLKIDKLFVDSLPEESRIAEAIIGLANSLGLTLVAEGVENDAQHQWLKEAGVHMAQGYLFAKAQQPESLAAILLAQSGNKP
ncbi:phosphodiesterase [Salmonella enterica subsp. enterica serovar Choleraesuis]|nr:phosphodiesterase [Salmonella enterica subsp. enterica serovar Choleraesuis]